MSNVLSKQPRVRKNVACDILATSAVAFMQHFHYVRVGILLAFACIGLAACSGDQEAEHPLSVNERTESDSAHNSLSNGNSQTFASTYQSFNTTEDLSTSLILSDMFYAVRRTEGDCGDETSSEGDSIIQRKMQNNSLGDPDILCTMPSDSTILAFDMDSERNLYIALRDEEGDRLMKLSSNGSVLFEVPFTDADEDDRYGLGSVHLRVNDRGFICLAPNSSILFLYDAKGQQIHTLSLRESDSLMCLIKDPSQNLYVVSSNDTSPESSARLDKINFEKASLEEICIDFPSISSSSQVCAKDERTLMISSGNLLYSYELDTKTLTTQASWENNDLSGDNIRAIGMRTNNTVFAVMDFHDENAVLISLDLSTPAKPHSDEKKTIVYGALFEGNETEVNIINEFNRLSDRYHVEIKAYYDPTNPEEDFMEALTRLNLEFLNGKGPDVIDLCSLENLDSYTSKGLFEDLNPYLQNSAVLSKEDFFPNLLERATHDGKLIYIPSSFGVETWMCKSSFVGNTPGWSISDALRLIDAHPDACPTDEWISDFSITNLIDMNSDLFIDPDTGECHFDSDLFKSILRFMKKGKDYANTHKNDARLDASRLADDSLLITSATIDDFNSIQPAIEMFGDTKPTWIGIPRANRTNGTFLNPYDCLGISANSSNKDGAWALIEYFLSKDPSDRFDYVGFSSRKSFFAKQKEKAIKGDYTKTQKNLLSFEYNTGVDRWIYKYRPLTRDEADTFEQLVIGANCAAPCKTSDANDIIMEECEQYFNGYRSLDDTVAVIQNRISLYVKEQ